VIADGDGAEISPNVRFDPYYVDPNLEVLSDENRTEAEL